VVVVVVVVDVVVVDVDPVDVDPVVVVPVVVVMITFWTGHSPTDSGASAPDFCRKLS
jgi:hypothetical protein